MFIIFISDSISLVAKSWIIRKTTPIPSRKKKNQIPVTSMVQEWKLAKQSVKPNSYLYQNQVKVKSIRQPYSSLYGEDLGF